MSGPVVVGRALHLAFGATPALAGAGLVVDPGEVVAVMGRSGSGKSTLLHVLAGLLRPDAGSVELCGEDIGTWSDRARSQLRLRHVGFVFQSGDLVPELTLVENVELPLRLTGVRASRARSRALEMLERLDVVDLAHRRTGQVSGGQAQRAAVARALVHEPAVVFADEPTGALDQVAGERVLDELVDLAAASRTAVVVVTHDLKVASYAQRDVQMRDGTVVVPVAVP